ncbi:MAG TPA: diaminopimelate epimerase [Gammaproteobacteria bacterium]
MRLKFVKMHGIGNDFVVFDAISQKVQLTPAQIRRIADRHFGIGCDQVLLVEKSPGGSADFGYRIFNADGGEVEQCGNGARCFMRFIHDAGLSAKSRLTVRTVCGDLELSLQPDGAVRVNMGVPEFAPHKIPFTAETTALNYILEVAGQTLTIGAVSMGNPHAVLQVDNVQTADVAGLGPAIESHPRFPRRVNAGFMQIVSRQHINLRVYERGAGETLACGSGACAAVAVGRVQELLESKVTVSLPGGDLIIEWPGPGRELWMSGPAERVFEGEITL